MGYRDSDDTGFSRHGMGQDHNADAGRRDARTGHGADREPGTGYRGGGGFDDHYDASTAPALGHAGWDRYHPSTGPDPGGSGSARAARTGFDSEYRGYGGRNSGADTRLGGGGPTLQRGRSQGSSQRMEPPDFASQQHDPDYFHYDQWRTEQVKQLDEDYQTWRSERYQTFSDEFNSWRSSRAGAAAAGSGASDGGGRSGNDNPSGHSLSARDGSRTDTSSTLGQTGGEHRAADAAKLAANPGKGSAQ